VRGEAPSGYEGTSLEEHVLGEEKSQRYLCERKTAQKKNGVAGKKILFQLSIHLVQNTVRKEKSTSQNSGAQSPKKKSGGKLSR